MACLARVETASSPDVYTLAAEAAAAVRDDITSRMHACIVADHVGLGRRRRALDLCSSLHVWDDPRGCAPRHLWRMWLAFLGAQVRRGTT